jgi:hypothetical protein
MRPIDADALIDKLPKEYLGSTIHLLINDAPTVSADAVQEWIPVSKRLPDTDVPVLVSDGVYVWEDELQEDYEDGKTMYWWDSQCGFDFNDTAWMPRPKPYKRDEK